MHNCFFVTDLHGSESRYNKLFALIEKEKPLYVLLGGDLLPHGFGIKSDYDDFFQEYLLKNFLLLRKNMKGQYPEVMVILGNDDPRVNEQRFQMAEKEGVWKYLHMEKHVSGDFTFYGYAHVPPTPFRLKDWERYDVSRYVDPGCIHPTDGFFSVEPEVDIEYASIKSDLEKLSNGDDLSNAVFLFHSPPYKTDLDRAALDGQSIDHVPLDVHVGSIAIMRFIEERQPLLTLHGHIHESSSITGNWKQSFRKTTAINGAWNGKELSLVRIDLSDPEKAVKTLV